MKRIMQCTTSFIIDIKIVGRWRWRFIHSIQHTSKVHVGKHLASVVKTNANRERMKKEKKKTRNELT